MFILFIWPIVSNRKSASFGVNDSTDEHLYVCLPDVVFSNSTICKNKQLKHLLTSEPIHFGFPAVNVFFFFHCMQHVQTFIVSKTMETRSDLEPILQWNAAYKICKTNADYIYCMCLIFYFNNLQS